MARLIEQTMTMDASTENAFRHASAVPAGFADQVKVSLEVHDLIIHELHKINRQFLERSAEDAGASRVEHAGMFIHSRCEVPQTASGTRTQRAGDESIEYRNGDGGLVNDNFKVADAMTTLVRVGELQRHGMTVGESTRKRKDSKSGNEAVRQDLEPKALNWYWLDEFEKVGGRLEGC